MCKCPRLLLHNYVLQYVDGSHVDDDISDTDTWKCNCFWKRRSTPVVKLSTLLFNREMASAGLIVDVSNYRKKLNGAATLGKAFVKRQRYSPDSLETSCYSSLNVRMTRNARTAKSMEKIHSRAMPISTLVFPQSSLCRKNDRPTDYLACTLE